MERDRTSSSMLASVGGFPGTRTPSTKIAGNAATDWVHFREQFPGGLNLNMGSAGLGQYMCGFIETSLPGSTAFSRAMTRCSASSAAGQGSQS